MSFTSLPIQTNPFSSYAASLTGTLTWGAILEAPGLEVNRALSFSGAGYTPQTNGLYVNFTSVTGTDSVNTGGVPYNYINISGDTAAFSNGPDATGLGLLVFNNFGGSGTLGQRACISAQLNQREPTNNNGPSTGNYPSYTGLIGNAVAFASDNGTGTTSTTSSGNMSGGGLSAELKSGATNWYGCCGLEVDVSVDSGASVYRKTGILIAQFSRDAVQGDSTGDDTALVIANQSGSVGWTEAIKIGNNQGGCLTTSGTVLRGGSVGAMSCKNGIDLTNFTFSGAPVLAPLQTPSSSSAAGTQGAICWDSGFIYICTATNTWKRATLNTF